jgi:hypothetical protein
MIGLDLLGATKAAGEGMRAPARTFTSATFTPAKPAGPKFYSAQFTPGSGPTPWTPPPTPAPSPDAGGGGGGPADGGAAPADGGGADAGDGDGGDAGDDSGDDAMTGLDVLGASYVQHGMVVVGAFDLNDLWRRMNTVKQPTVGIARILLRDGQATAARTKTQGATMRDAAERDKTYWALDWHAKELAKATDANAIYAPGDDLKKWVAQAYIDANSVEEGASWADANMSRMWSDIGAAIAALPQKVRDTVESAATALVPWYVWLGGAVLVGGVLWAAYRILHRAAPSFGEAAAKRYLP